jgi:hypothetical protein
MATPRDRRARGHPCVALIADGMIVEHWACRDDMGLLEQLHD